MEKLIKQYPQYKKRIKRHIELFELTGILEYINEVKIQITNLERLKELKNKKNKLEINLEITNKEIQTIISTL